MLDQIEQVQAAVDVFLRHRNHEAKVRLHQIFLGALRLLLAVTDDGECMLQLFKRRRRADFALFDFAFQLADLPLLCSVILAFELFQFAVEG